MVFISGVIEREFFPLVKGGVSGKARIFSGWVILRACMTSGCSLSGDSAIPTSGFGCSVSCV